MTERQLQFRVGIFVLAAAVATGVMVFKFGEIPALWQGTYPLAIRFEGAPGVFPGTPVRRGGVPIGRVRTVDFDEERGGVSVVVDIDEQVRLRADATPRLARSLLGDTCIEFDPGTSPDRLAPGARLAGTAPVDPMQIVERMDRQLGTALESFVATSREWQTVGKNLNGLMDTNRGNFDLVVERAAESLDQFSRTMKQASETLAHVNATVADPRNQENLRKTLDAMPQMVAETRQAIAAVRSAVEKADANLENLRGVTEPLAARSTSIVVKLDNTLTHLESLSGELDTAAQLIAKKDGTLHQFVANPELYQHLAASAASLSVLLKNMEPIAHDMRIFSDKVARHPELMGVGGYLKGSSGLKEPAPVRQTSLPSRGGGRQ